MSIEELVEEFSIARYDRYAAIKAEILKIGSPLVPFLVRAYRSKKIDMWDCFQTILEMGPTVYVPILEAARDDNEEAMAILSVVANHREPLPEVIPILIDGLQSPNSMKILRCLGAILHVYPLIEVRDRDQLPQFSRATNPLLDLLGHENEHVRREAARCIAVLRPVEPDVLPALMRTLKEKDPCKDSDEAHALIQGIRAYGPEGADAIPILAEILRSQAGRWLKIETAQALARIGAAAASTVSLLEEFRDKTELQSKSETRWFKRTMNKIITSIQNASVPTPKKRRHGDSYLLNLINRMGRHYDGVGTSDNSTSHKAYEEARNLANASLIPRIADVFETRLNRHEFHYLAFILGHVTRNTKSGEGRQLIRSLLSRDNLRREDINALIFAATTCGLKEASLMIRQVLCRDHGRHVWEALDYFKAIRDDSAIEDIGRCIEELPKYAMFCISALADIRSLKAIPRLLEIAKGDFPPAVKAKWEWKRSAIAALGQIGDPAPVPDLIWMLSDRKYRSDWPTIVNALCLMEDERGFVPVLATLRKVIAMQAFAKYWSPGSRTVIVNSLDYLNKIGKKDDPFVLEVVEMLQSEPNWSRLLKEEKEFIQHWWQPRAGR